MKLILIRHGESEANANHLFALDETKLTQRGIVQAKVAGKELKEKYKIDMAFCSPFKRCIETLEAILMEYPIEGPVFMCKLIEERDFGEFLGMETQLISPEELDKDSKANEEIGIETLANLEKRINLFLEDLKLEDENSTILIVSHREALRMMISKITGKELEEIEVRNGEILEFDYSK
jgi:alpha-ribazole phosphatase